MEAPIRVLIVDDHPVFRYGIRSLLMQDPAIAVVGEAGDATSALETISHAQPEVVLLDIRMPGCDGIALARKIRGAYPSTKVIILTAHENEDYLLDALSAGVHGYLLKNTSHRTLLAAVHDVHAGGQLLDPGQKDIVRRQLEGPSTRSLAPAFDLTELELRVLVHLAAGNNYDQIGLDLHVAEPTVKRMVAGIIAKMGVSSRTQAVADAMRAGLI